MIAAEVKEALSQFVDKKVMKVDKSPKELKKLNHLHKNLQGKLDQFFKLNSQKINMGVIIFLNFRGDWIIKKFVESPLILYLPATCVIA